MPVSVQSKASAARSALRLGFLALTDAAPLVAAQELGLQYLGIADHSKSSFQACSGT